MRRKAGLLVTAAIAAAIVPSSGRPVTAQTSAAPDAFTLEGTCSRLVVNGSDVSDLCRDAVMYMMLPVGRVLFMFSAADGRAIVFSGDQRLVQNPEADAFVQPVDIVRTGYRQADLTSFDVSGQCAGTNPFAGQATLVCRAEVDGALFAAEFTSDGRPPADLR